MYEEQVKLFRYCAEANCAECAVAGCPGPQKFLKQAADAIEELSHEYESIEKSLTKSLELVRKLQSQRWIPVTEQLPDAFEEILLQFPSNQAAGFCDRDGYWSVYLGDGLYTEVAKNEPKPTHWARKILEPPKEET